MRYTGAYAMLRRMMVNLMVLGILLGGCGTTSGIAEGTGKALEGAASDFRDLGGVIRR